MSTQLITSRPNRFDVVTHDASADVDYTVRRIGAVVVLLCSLLIASVVVSAAYDAVRGLGGRPAAASETAAPAASVQTPTVYVAAAGDTLWSIAERHRGQVELTRYVDALVQLNGGASIVVGQAVRLP